MPDVSMRKYGLFGVYDTGAPEGKDDYTTLVSIHGFAWHSGNFIRLLPLAGKHSARVVLLNRRDYPGSTPLSEEELKPYRIAASSTSIPESLAALQLCTKERARELYEFLQTFVEKEKVPAKDGLVISGWSLGATLVTSFLAHVRTFPAGRVDLTSYIRYIVTYNVPSVLLGYKPPVEDVYNPLDDMSISPSERLKTFNRWITSYYSHGPSASTLQYRDALSAPPPSIESMSEDDIAASVYPPPVAPGGSDDIVSRYGQRSGLFGDLREGALFPSPIDGNENNWDNVELRFLVCDHAVWMMPWARWKVQEEIAEAKEAGRRVRPVQFLTLEGANHYVHWDDPDRLLQIILNTNVEQ